MHGKRKIWFPGSRRMKAGKRRTGSFKKYLFLSVCIAFMAYLSYLYLFQFRPVFITMARNQANSLAVQAINQSVSEVMQQTSYEDLISLMKGENDKITAIVSNIVTMNRLKSQLVLHIDRNIQQIENLTLRIPVGTVLGIDFLSGIGPRMQLSILATGLTKADFVNQFDDAGINQTRHRIVLKVDTSINILIPNYNPVTASVSTQIPIAETVIVGEVPEAYNNLETEEAKLRDDILELQ